MSPENLGIFITCLIALIPLVYFIQKLSGKSENRNITPQPLQVAAVPRYMTAEDCAAKHEASETLLDQRFKAMSHEFRAILQEELRKMEDLHTARTDAFKRDVSDKVGGVHRRVDLIFKVLTRKGVKVDDD